MPTLDCAAGNLNLVLTAGRDKVVTFTATGVNTTGYTHQADFRETPDLDSNVLFSLSSEGGSPQITQTPGANSVISFQFLAANTADLGGKTIYWSWKVIDAASKKDDWVEGFVTINPTPTA